MSERERCIEMVVEADFGLTRGFVIGYLMGRSLPPEVFFHRICGIHSKSLVEYLMEQVGLAPEATYFVACGPAASALLEVFSTTAPLGIRLLHTREVVSARFRFSYKAFSEEDGARLLQLFSDLPPGVVLSDDYQPEQEVHEEDAGVEAYAPAHHYQLRVHGEVSGAVKGVLTLGRACEMENLVDKGEIELEHLPEE
jgi:hypothetical protein